MSYSATLPILLKQLKLSGMATFWESYLEKAEKQRWNPAQYLAALCEEEINQRYSRRVARYFKESKLPVGKTLSSFDFNHLPKLNSMKIETLASDPAWVKRAENLLFLEQAAQAKLTWQQPYATV